MSRIDDLRGVLTPTRSGDRGLSKLSLKYRDQKRSLTPLKKIPCNGLMQEDRFVGKENVCLQEAFFNVEEECNSTSCSNWTYGMEHPQTQSVLATTNSGDFSPSAVFTQSNITKLSTPNLNRVVQSLAYTPDSREPPVILDTAIITTPSSSSDSEDAANIRCTNRVVVISDSDDEQEDNVQSVSSVASEIQSEQDVAFLCTPSICDRSRAVRIGLSTASVSSSRKIQLLRSILNSSNSSAEGTPSSPPPPSPRPLIERILRTEPRPNAMPPPLIERVLRTEPKPNPMPPPLIERVLMTEPKPNPVPPHRSIQKTWTRREPTSVNYTSEDSSDDDEVFEQFLEKCKTPAKSVRVSLEQKFETFVVSDDNSSSDENDEMFYLRVNNASPANDCLPKPSYINTVRNSVNNTRTTSIPTLDRPKLARPNERTSLTFLASLSTHPSSTLLDSRAAAYIKDFKKRKTELVTDLYVMYNEKIFEKKLPEDMQITWNPRLTATAGYCYTKQDLKGTRTARLELSTKVLDCAERVRDTLIHELCHAATWLINGVRDGHGRYWKYWARLAQIKFPELPPVSRCHTYQVKTKYTYRCKVCGYSIGRHSKSLDVKKKLCGKCHGHFELVVNNTPSRTPKTPGKFAIFVKENYGLVKKTNRLNSHADVMKSLSEEFASKNKIV